MRAATYLQVVSPHCSTFSIKGTLRGRQELFDRRLVDRGDQDVKLRKEKAESSEMLLEGVQTAKTFTQNILHTVLGIAGRLGMSLREILTWKIPRSTRFVTPAALAKY
jgi:hypothetical protein